MQGLIGWVGRGKYLGYSIQRTCRKCCTIQFHAKKKGKDSHIWTNSNQNEILTSHKTRALFHTFPLTLTLTLLFIKCVVQPRLFVTYLYVYVYDNISKDNNSKFFLLHQIRILSAGLGMAWNRDGLSCNGSNINSLRMIFVFLFLLCSLLL